MIYGPITTPASTGGAGASAATKVSPEIVKGVILGIAIQYNDAPPAATTDVGIKTKGLSGKLPSYNILTISNAATDDYFVPQVQTKTSAGVDTGQYNNFTVEDYIQLDLAGANDGDSVSIWLYMLN